MCPRAFDILFHVRASLDKDKKSFLISGALNGKIMKDIVFIGVEILDRWTSLRDDEYRF